jgi:hypothetical protein
MDGFEDGDEWFDDANYTYMEDTYIEAVCLNTIPTGLSADALSTNASLAGRIGTACCRITTTIRRR